jgi:hypothetical protein
VSPTTSAQVKRREAARKTALARQDSLEENKRRRDQQELDLAIEFMEADDDRTNALRALRAAEIRMGHAVNTLIGELRISYSRAAHLLARPATELKRLRHLATQAATPPAETTDQPETAVGTTSPTTGDLSGLST